VNILEALNSGALHNKARTARPDCVDAKGNIHANPDRAKFVDWLAEAKATRGDNVQAWAGADRAEYDARYIPSH